MPSLAGDAFPRQGDLVDARGIPENISVLYSAMFATIVFLRKNPPFDINMPIYVLCVSLNELICQDYVDANVREGDNVVISRSTSTDVYHSAWYGILKLELSMEVAGRFSRRARDLANWLQVYCRHLHCSIMKHPKTRHPCHNLMQKQTNNLFLTCF